MTKKATDTRAKSNALGGALIGHILKGDFSGMARALPHVALMDESLTQSEFLRIVQEHTGKEPGKSHVAAARALVNPQLWIDTLKMIDAKEGEQAKKDSTKTGKTFLQYDVKFGEVRDKALETIAEGKVKTARTVFNRVWVDVEEKTKEQFHDANVARAMRALENALDNAKADGVKYKGTTDLVDELGEILPSAS